MKAAAYTLGCKVNQYDTNAMMELLEAAGFQRVGFHEEADVYLLNTCTVTNVADKKSRNMIRRLHKNHPGAIICVCGCLAQRDGEALLKTEGVSAVIGTERRRQIVSIVRECLDGKRVDGVQEIGSVYEELRVKTAGELTRGYIKIQEGCNNFCSYCIIPYVRGRVRSRGSGEIYAEAQGLAEAGVQEIVLTGIHISSYGEDTGEDLFDLLHRLDSISGIRRIRLGSLEPHILTEDFVRGLKTLGKVCPHFHISLQSGSSSVLKRMNRKYTASQFAGYLDTIRRTYDCPAVTTDVITGFPGETEQEFQETRRFLEEQQFSRIHVFPYSERKGTPAERMEEKIPVSVRRERANDLIELGKRLEYNYAERFIGTVQDVLFEQAAGDGMAEGYTDRYLRVHADGIPGALEKVLLQRCENGILYGKR